MNEQRQSAGAAEAEDEPRFVRPKVLAIDLAREEVEAIRVGVNVKQFWDPP